MRAPVRSAWRWVAAMLLWRAVALPAQGVESRDAQCRADRVWSQPVDAVGPLHPKRVIERLRPLVERGAWSEALASVSSDFLSQAPPDLSESDRRKMERRLMLLGESLQRVEAESGVSADRQTLAIIKPGEFKPQQGLSGSDYTIFEGDSTEIAINNTLPLNASRHLCWTALTVLQLMTVYSQPAFQVAVTELKRVNTLWEHFNQRGYSRLPWEMALNDRLFIKAKDVLPPTKQLILMHPSAAFEVRGPDYKNLTRDVVAAVEPIGMVFYNANRTFYWGGSVAASFPEKAPAGVGFIIHLGKHAAIGHIWRSADSTGQRRNAFIASLDAFDLFSKVPERLEQAKAAAGALGRKKVGDLLQKAPS